MMKPIFDECVDIVKSIAGNDYLYFDNAVEVKSTPYSPPFNAWAVCASPDDRLFVMDNDEEWHQIELSDKFSPLLIASLYQRLMLMRVSYAKAS